VTEVVDGRTCVIQLTSGKVTAVLQYIEIPEPEQPLYQAVREHLTKLVLGQTVEFLPRIVMKDRTAGQLLVKGVDVSQQMLRDGAAWYSIPEQSGQDPAESLVYIDNETQAKAEKRGVWSLAELQPSWEYRAEQAALQRRKDEEEAKRAAFLREMESRKKVPVRPQVMAQMEMWANVGGASEFDQPLGFGELRAGYDPRVRIGHISTPSLYLDFPNSDFLGAETRAFYVYRGDKTNIEDSVYAVGVLVKSKGHRFIKSNNLIITADGQKISLGRARRFPYEQPSFVVELLVYKITRAQLMKIAKAEKISFQIGAHRGVISNSSLITLNNLLNVS
jgi:endonuclease YncB( thermonuclease family)